ncbi:MAG TPA: glycoside hydrolase family 2 TIM barrel-domain containing protein [Pyrinomonadaceae bacterium]
MKKLLVLILFLACAVEARAQATGLIANIAGRNHVSLDGQWKAIIDPYESGDQYHFNRDASPKSKSEFQEYSFDATGSLSVPGDWNTQRAELFFYEGAVWYKKSFDYERKGDTRLFVHFGAANYIAEVYLNGEKVGRHEGGFTPFNFEITNLVKEKENSLVVKVDNKRYPDGVPTLMTDWWNYGGLTRAVTLVVVPQTFIEDYFLQLRRGTKNQISGWVKLNGDKLAQKITVRIPEAKINKTFTTDANGTAQINFTADLSLWSPENPKLYNVSVEAETDHVEDSIGFRSIEVKGTEILLNGKPMFLRGVCIHEEAPLRSGRAYSREDAETLLGWAKELGANFVRLAHYPHNELMVREADRMGLLVWSEIPVYWGINFESPVAFAAAQNQLNEMIARDHNRACVILWSVANETPNNPARLTFLKKLVERARVLDPTRLMTAAMLHHYADERTQMIDDPLAEVLDVIGCNEYIGWYDGLPTKADTMEWKTIYQKPVVMSEFGAEAVYGLHGDDLTRWTEEYQESFYRHQLGMLKRIPFLRGTSPWILMDFRSPRRLLPGVQDYYNRKGLVSNRGERKKAFYVMQEFYRELQQRADH